MPGPVFERRPDGLVVGVVPVDVLEIDGRVEVEVVETVAPVLRCALPQLLLAASARFPFGWDATYSP